ncbi:Dopey, N-terminal-domain-containing protein [Globomyces pollinis-pini]|nr:Dopey, N-terminal-domain-containing protein [Globomyces pollinis-pini]
MSKSNESNVNDYTKNSDYIKFASAIEKALSTFDSITEWQDIIGFLSKITKIFVSHRYTITPKKLLLAKRLAQTLNPALPAGVHQKSLEAYNLILSNIGPSQLAIELPIWSFGLFPFCAHAAMSTKPLLLNIYLTHYIPLGDKLGPTLKAFILAILPCLDEENNEYFDKGSIILEKLSKATNIQDFYTCFWKAIISSSSCRNAAMNFLLRRMPKITSREDMVMICGNQTSILTTALCSLLEDNQLLVKRGCLELMVTQFSSKNRSFSDTDMERIISSAITVVLYKEMSLNRRLYIWLKDCDNIVMEVLRNMLMQEHDDVNRVARPYKIIHHLLDKPDFMETVLEPVFQMMLVKIYQNSSRLPNFKSILVATTNVLLSDIPPFLFWKTLYFWLLNTDVKDEGKIVELCLVITFIMDHFSFVEDEIQRVHLPFFYYGVLSMVLRIIQGAPENYSMIDITLKLAVKIAYTISNSVLVNTWYLKDFRGASIEKQKKALQDTKNTDYFQISVDDISKVYRSQSKSESLTETFLATVTVGKSVTTAAFDILCKIVDNCEMKMSLNNKNSLTQSLFLNSWQSICTLLERHIHYSPSTDWRNTTWLAVLQNVCVTSDIFEIFSLALDVVISITLTTKVTVRGRFFKTSTQKLWSYLSQNFIHFHSKVIRLICRIGKVITVPVLESYISEILLTAPISQKKLQFQKFGIFWRSFEKENVQKFSLSRSLFVVFDAINNEDGVVHAAGVAWITAYVRSPLRLLEPLLLVLTHHDIQLTANFSATQSEVQLVYAKKFNTSQVAYALQILYKVFKLNHMDMIKVLGETACADMNVNRFCGWANIGSSFTYVDSILILATAFVLAQWQTCLDCDRFEERLLYSIKSQAAKVISLVSSQSSIIISPSVAKCIYKSLMTTLKNELGRSRFSNQPHFLTALKSIAAHVYATTTFEKLYPEKDARGNFISIFQQAIQKHSGGSVLQSWIEAVVYHIPYVQTYSSKCVLPIIKTICNQLCIFTDSLISNENNYIPPDLTESDEIFGVGSSNSPENDALMLLSGLEMILKICLPKESLKGEESTPDSRKELYPIFSVYFYLLKSINSFEGFTNDRTFLNPLIVKVSRTLKELGVLFPRETLESIIFVWSIYVRHNLEDNQIIFKMISFTIPESSLVFSELIEILKARLNPKLTPIESKLSENEILEFCICYLKVIDSTDNLDNCWSALLSYLKIAVNTNGNNLPSNLIVFLDKYFDLRSDEGRKLWKESNDIYQKVYDQYITIIGKAFDKGNVATPVASTNTTADYTKDYVLLLKCLKSYGLNVDNIMIKQHSEDNSFDQILDYIADTSIPKLKSHLSEDYILILLANLVHSVINPVLKNKECSRNLLLGKFMKLLCAITAIPFGYKIWKKDIWNYFFETRFFQIGLETFRSYKKVIHSLISNDMELIMDVLGRISVVSSTALFSDRKFEIQNRVSMIRRLTFCIFSAPQDWYLVKLPTIQEKLTESLKMNACAVQSEIFFCIQVIFLRISSKHLTNFWPIIINELMTFLSLVDNVNETKPEELHVLLAACKLLYVLCSLKLNEFQMYQWMFVSDTIDRFSKQFSLANNFQKTWDSPLSPTIPDPLNMNIMSVSAIQSPCDLIPYLKSIEQSLDQPLDLNLDDLMENSFLEKENSI